MASKDLHNNLKLTKVLAPVAIASNTTTVGATIDTQGFESVEFAIESGVLTDGAYEVKVFEGDASNMSDEAEVTNAAHLLGSAPSFALTEDGTVKKVGYRGGKRYVRAKIVSTSVTSGGLFSVLAIQGHAANAPVA